MTESLALQCQCGAVRGVIDHASPATTNRCVCYCDDCQAFARFLARADLVDSRGGSDIVQVAPGRIRFTFGVDHLRSMRLSERGLFRWFTDCCRTPAGNMLYTRRSPFVGLNARFISPGDRSLDAWVGPSRGGLQGRFAIGGSPPGVPDRVGAGLLLRSAGWIATNVATGGHRGSPYWDASGDPIRAPRVLTKIERDQLRPA